MVSNFREFDSNIFRRLAKAHFGGQWLKARGDVGNCLTLSVHYAECLELVDRMHFLAQQVFGKADLEILNSSPSPLE
jgi:hypothetical protein